MKSFFVFKFLSLLTISASVFAHTQSYNDAAMGSDELGIPEPLIFDLVRPLGSPKGELEVNLFANESAEDKTLAWSPEIEYVFADGYAIELELPYSNTTLQEFKIAVQGTFGTLMQGQMIHGWQVIARKGFGAQMNAGDLLYLNGSRLSSRLSTMNMVGLRKSMFESGSGYTKLVNSAWFYDASPNYTLGLEINNEVDRQGHWRYRLTPQIHFSIKKHVSFQVGVGPSTLNKAKNTDWILASRLSYSF
jgi:hypothetical protein